MNAITQTASDARAEAIAEALYDAICDGDGRPRPDALAHHLAKHGLVIVEAARHDKLMATLQFVGSVLEPIVAAIPPTPESPLGYVFVSLRNVVTRIRELERELA